MKNKIYKEEIRNAINATLNENCLVPEEAELLGKYNPYRSNNTYEALYSLFIKHFAEADETIDLSKVRGQCLNYHTQILDMMKKEFNVNAVLTIGYVNFYEEDFWKFEKISPSLVRTLPNGKDRVIDIHVWLTLPSLEIIDLTFLAHIAYITSQPEKQLRLRKATDFPYCFGTAEFLFNEEKIIYHPKYIGTDILLKNGFARS